MGPQEQDALLLGLVETVSMGVAVRHDLDSLWANVCVHKHHHLSAQEFEGWRHTEAGGMEMGKRNNAVCVVSSEFSLSVAQ
jgi:hypothetical protein